MHANKQLVRIGPFTSVTDTIHQIMWLVENRFAIIIIIIIIISKLSSDILPDRQ